MGIRSLSTASISTGVKRSKVWDQSAVYTAPVYDSISTITVGAGGSSSVSFTSIPNTYKHLQIRAIARNSSAPSDSLYTFNGDTGSNYAWHLLVGNGSAAQAYTASSVTAFRGSPYFDNAASVFGSGVTDILDYTDTNKNTTVRTLTAMENNTVNYSQVQYYSGLWVNTAVVNQITITPSAGTFAQYSHFALYGIRG